MGGGGRSGRRAGDGAADDGCGGGRSGRWRPWPTGGSPSRRRRRPVALLGGTIGREGDVPPGPVPPGGRGPAAPQRRRFPPCRRGTFVAGLFRSFTSPSRV